MSTALVYVLVILGAPIVWALCLLGSELVRRRWRESGDGRPSVADIVARVEAERARAGDEVRYWPRIDPDHRQRRRELPTEVMPRLSVNSEPTWKPSPHPRKPP